jgi:hypothetical protein
MYCPANGSIFKLKASTEQYNIAIFDAVFTLVINLHTPISDCNVKCTVSTILVMFMCMYSIYVRKQDQAYFACVFTKSVFLHSTEVKLN